MCASLNKNTNNINAFVSSVKYMFDIIFGNLLKAEKKNKIGKKKWFFHTEREPVAARTRV